MPSEMRILTLWQPWASLIAMGLKSCETRSWGTEYRGKLAIHAAKREMDVKGFIDLNRRFPEIAKSFHFEDLAIDHVRHEGLPYGCIVAIADLIDCRMMTPRYSTISEGTYAYISEQSTLERAVGDWRTGRYAWRMENVRQLTEPIPYKGGQGLRKLEDAATLYAIAARLP